MFGIGSKVASVDSFVATSLKALVLLAIAIRVTVAIVLSVCLSATRTRSCTIA